jgi:PKD repeat protein/photosystem II stability/assembly factor-like uncharacterized protein
MKKFFLLFSFVLISSTLLKAQNQTTILPASNDTAIYPYWIEMMQDPNANFYQTQRAFNIYWNDRKVTRSSGWKVFKRWEYMMQSRVNPDGSQPAPDATFNAYVQYQTKNRSASGTWTSMGPAEIPAPGPAGYEGLGRINTVAFHPTDPNKFYIGAPSGGMWQTSDGGLTWISHTDTLPTLGVSSIIIDYSNPVKILIGTGDRDAGDAPGMGVFKSLDGGLTWTPSKTGMDNKTVGGMIQHPSNPLIIVAATSGGIYRSTDGGANWTNQKSGDFKSIAFKPNDPNVVYAASGANFYRSADNGINWTQISSGLTGGQRGVIAVTPANPNYVYFLQSDGSSGFKGVYRSSDAGFNFSTRSTSPNILDWSCDGSGTGGQGWYDLALAADPVNAETIYVGGVDVWKSTNGGSTWTINSHWYGGCNVPAVHADCHYLTFSPVNNKLYAGNDGGVYSTSNGGTTWSDHTVGMTIGQIYKMGQSQTVKNMVINGFQDNGTYTITPGGWVATGGGDGMECAIDYTNAAYTYHTVYYGDIYRKYNNSGERHIAGNGVNGIDESGAWVTPFILSEADPKGMFVGYKNVWRCSNVVSNSIVWTKISNNLNGSNNVDMAGLEQSPANTNILYAVRSDKRLFRTDNCMDPTPLWYDLTAFLPVSATPTDIEAHATNPDIVYMTLNKNIYKSVDRGLSWVSITGNLPSLNMNTVAFYRNAPEGLYIGTDAGVYYKDTTMTEWVAFSDGLPVNGRITELDIYYDNDSVSEDAIRASTYGRGLWGSDLFHSAPMAEFSTSKTTIPTGCAIDFKDESSGVPTYFEWTFTGASPATSSLKNPTGITYTAIGTYPVKLKCWNEFGMDSIVKTGYITVNGTLTPAADFSASKEVLCSGEYVRFTDLSENCPVSWSWQFTPNTVTFLEGTSVASQNPVVQFNEARAYDVQLTAFNFVGPGVKYKPAYIINDGYGLPFEGVFDAGFNTQHWQVLNPDFWITWDTISVPGTLGGRKATWMNFFEYETINRRDQMISPPLNFTDYNLLTLNFRHAYAQKATMKDSLIIRISSDCGVSWDRVWGAGPNGTDSVFVTHAPMTTAFYPQSDDDWCGGSYGVGCYSIDLSPWAGMNNIKIMFEAYCRFGNNLFIDNISISGPVGIDERQNGERSFSLYPNPTSGNINLLFHQDLGETHIGIYNLQGHLITSSLLPERKSKTTHLLDLTGYSKGMYFIKVTSDKTTEIEKIIIQ